MKRFWAVQHMVSRIPNPEFQIFIILFYYQTEWDTVVSFLSKYLGSWKIRENLEFRIG